MDDVELNMVYDEILKRIKERKLVVYKRIVDDEWIVYESNFFMKSKLGNKDKEKDKSCMYNTTCKLGDKCEDCDDYYIQNYIE